MDGAMILRRMVSLHAREREAVRRQGYVSVTNTAPRVATEGKRVVRRVHATITRLSVAAAHVSLAATGTDHVVRPGPPVRSTPGIRVRGECVKRHLHAQARDSCAGVPRRAVRTMPVQEGYAKSAEVRASRVAQAERRAQAHLSAIREILPVKVRYNVRGTWGAE